MHTPTVLLPLLSSLLLTTTTTLAAPAAAAPRLTPFYLVSTTTATPSYNSSLLPSVSAISLFDPNYQETFLLRAQPAGYFSLPTFTFSHSTLHTLTTGPHGIGPVLQYNATRQEEDAVLGFLPMKVKKANLGLEGGYLLAFKGEAEGWTLCPGDFGESVVMWKGSEEGCTAIYLQAVEQPPY